jgi:arylsulfatase A-like enzyme
MTRSRPLSPFLDRGLPAVLLAWSGVLVLELAWGLRSGVGLGGGRLLALASVCAAVLCLAALLGEGIAALDRRLGSGRGGWVAGVVALGPAWLAADSLFSGGWIRTVAGVGFMKLGLALALAASAVVVARLARRAADGQLTAPWWSAVLVAGLLVSSVADHTLFVGHYLAFHLLGGVVAVVCALLLGARVAARVPTRVARVGGLLVCGLALAVPVLGGGRAADALVTYTHGLVPKARWLAAGAADLFDGRSAAAPLPEFGSVPPPELLRSPSDLGQAPWSRSGGLEGEGLSLRAAGATDRLTQRTAERHLAGRSHTASVRLRTPAGDGSVSATLVLRDDRDQREVRAEGRLGEQWTSLQVDLPAQDPAEVEQALEPYVIPPARIRHNEGLAYTVGLPEELLPLADNVRPEGTPGLVLFEDGQPVGPVRNVHRLIKQEGGGAWSAWSLNLWFSTPDGSDPRTNGRRYELVREVDLTPGSSSSGTLTWELLIEGPGEVQLEQPSLIEPLPTSGAELAQRLAEEFRLSPTAGAAADAARASARNVVVVVIDALRQDHVGPRADGISLTPRLDGLAAQGVTFSQTYSPSDHTGRSVPCLATGLPLEVTLRAADWGVALRPWLEILREAGWDTFNNGSDYITRRYEHVPLPELLGAAHGGTLDSKADMLAEEIVEFAATRAGRPFAVATHWSYAHVGRRKEMADDYAEMVSVSDRYLGQLLDGLERVGVADDTLVMVTADHGYGLGEAGRYLGAHGCAELSLRVPLVVRGPGLAVGGRVDRPVGNLSVAPTLLDLLVPEAQPLLGAESLLPELLDPTVGDGRAAPVFSSMGFSFMTRSGDYKLTEDRSYRTAGLFDLAQDPAEREPLEKPRVESRLRALRHSEEDRQARLSQALVAAQRAVLSPDVMAAFASSRPGAGDVAPLLDRLWDYDERTAEFLLAELYRRRIEGLGSALDDLARGDGSRADDLLRVIRLWSGSDAALGELQDDLVGIHEDARLWLGAMLPDLEDDTIAALAPTLQADVQGRWAQEPGFDGPEQRWVALVCYGLTPRLPSAERGALKDLTIELFNAWSQGDDEGPYFSTLRDRRFMRRMLLDVFRDAPAADDLQRADRLVHNRHAAERLPRMCRELGSLEAKQWMLDLLRRWDARREDPPGRFVAYMIPELVQFEDAAFRAQANAIIQERFPLQAPFD